MYSLKRKNMVSRLMKLGITDKNVLKAMDKVERHLFLPKGLEHQAYDEKALPIGFSQTISHPYTVALMSQSIKVEYGQKILEIGTGSGYQAAILCELGAQVFTIERIAQIGKSATDRLNTMHYHFVSRIGNGALGWQTYAPFDSIIVTAGAPVLPEKLFTQIKINGKLIIPVGDKDSQILTLYTRQEEGYIKKELETLKFVPFIGV